MALSPWHSANRRIPAMSFWPSVAVTLQRDAQPASQLQAGGSVGSVVGKGDLRPGGGGQHADEEVTRRQTQLLGTALIRIL